MAFKIGDVVEVKGGGPSMTVESVFGYVVKALWFEKAKLMNGSFEEATLKFVDSSLQEEHEEDI